MCTLPTRLLRLTLDNYGLSPTTTMAAEVERLLSILPDLTSLTVEYKYRGPLCDHPVLQNLAQRDEQQIECLKAEYRFLTLHACLLMV